MDSVQFSPLSHVRFYSPMDCSTPGLPVHHQLHYSNSCPSSWWCDPTISYSVIPFSRLQSLTVSGSFLMSQFFESGGQSIGVPASTLVLPMNIQNWFPSGLTGLFSLQSKGLFKSLQHHNSKASILKNLAFLMVNSHINIWLLEKQ